MSTGSTTRPARRGRLVTILAGIAVAVVAVDQVTKQIAVDHLQGRPRIPVLGDLAGFTFYRNPGAAFGMGENTTWLFALIATGVFVGILLAARRLGSRGWAWGLGLLLGGLTGNLLDRFFRAPGFFHGHVIDFLDLYWFVCNVADVAITGAAAVIILLTFRGVGLDGSRDTDGQGQGASAAGSGAGEETRQERGDR
ncbi:signal peptidase II [Brevibacterium litoralis]|uniref:signal peptidase II n=1 Tax=Brevibacterium litoralis TaxID=3138935 RepID=UPI0032EF16E9